MQSSAKLSAVFNTNNNNNHEIVRDFVMDDLSDEESKLLMDRRQFLLAVSTGLLLMMMSLFALLVYLLGIRKQRELHQKCCPKLCACLLGQEQRKSESSLSVGGRNGAQRSNSSKCSTLSMKDPTTRLQQPLYNTGM